MASSGYYSPLSSQYGGWKPPQQSQPAPAAAPAGAPAQGAQGAAPQSSGSPAPGQPPQTFRQMQQAGVARPPAPAYAPQGSMAVTPTGMTAPTSAGQSPVMQAQTGGTATGAVGTAPAATPTSGYSMYGLPPANTGIGQMLGAPGTVSTGGSTAVGPGAGAPGGSAPPAPTSTVSGAGGQVGATTSAPGVNPFANGNYGATAPTSTSQQNTANAMGTSLQNLLLGNVSNPNPQATSPLTSGSGSASALAQQQLANPNPYNSQNIQTMMSVLNTPIVEQQQQEIGDTQAAMAQRGVFDSSLAQGNLQDINTAAGEQQMSAADTLLQNAANAQLTGTNSAISNAAALQNQAFNQGQTATTNAVANQLGYSNTEFNQALQTNQENLAQTQAQNQNLLALLGMS